MARQSGSDVVITGYSITSAAGLSAEDLFGALRTGSCLLGRISRFAADEACVRYASECKPISPMLLPDRKVFKVLNQKDLTGLVTLLRAYEHAGLAPNAIDPEKLGLFVGAGSTQIDDLTPYFTAVKTCVNARDGLFDSDAFGRRMIDLVNPMVVMRSLLNNTLCFGSKFLDARGPNSNFMDPDVAGMRAILEAYHAVREGRCLAAVAGGVAPTVDAFTTTELARMDRWNCEEDMSPTKLNELVRPFDPCGEGSLPAEGAAFLVLESADNAKRRGARVLGRIVGGSSAHHRNLDASMTYAMQKAFKYTERSPDELGLIVAQASGDRHCDAFEARAYINILGQRKERTPVVSFKGRLGDTCEASGPMALCIGADMMSRKNAYASFNAASLGHGDFASVSASEQEIHHSIGAAYAVNRFGGSVCILMETA